jgi:hypothetical protein
VFFYYPTQLQTYEFDFVRLCGEGMMSQSQAFLTAGRPDFVRSYLRRTVEQNQTHTSKVARGSKKTRHFLFGKFGDLGTCCPVMPHIENVMSL